MMRRDACESFQTAIDEDVRGELDARRARALAAHAGGCADCASELRRARAAQQALATIRGDALQSELDEARLAAVRRNVLATLRTEVARAESGRGLGWGWLGRLGGRAALGFAAAAGIVISMGPLRGVLSPPAQAPVVKTEGSGADIPLRADRRSMKGTSVLEYQDLNLTTLHSHEGVTLRWQGPNTSYLVLQSQKPGSFAGATATLVCGSSFTDATPREGAVFYKVVPVGEHCES